MSGGGYKERDVEVPRAPAPVIPKLFEDIHLPAPVPVAEPAHGLGPPDSRALLDWMDDAPAAAPPNLLGFVHTEASRAPIQLNPNAPRKPMPRGGPGPQLPADDLARVGDTMEAQRLLTSKDLKSGDHANQALQILNDVPEEQRGKAIDGLNEQAFDNLLERVPHGDREKFEKLVEASKDPKRKLKLWAEFHKSRARNDLGRRKGDIGGEDPYVKQDVDDLTREPGAPEREHEDIDAGEEIDRTNRQQHAHDRHNQRAKSVVKTHEEVDQEMEDLLAKAEAKPLTLAQVDEMRERKDLEYEIERDNNLNLTSERSVGLSGDIVTWEKYELELVRTTLARLPDAHARNRKALHTLHRKPSPHLMAQTGGAYQNGQIDITDWGASRGGAGVGHAGDSREMVSDQFRREHGDKINPLEHVLTHEVGHSVADKDKKAFEKFKKAAGWQEVDVDALRKDNVDEAKIAELESVRADPNKAQLNIGSENRAYSPIPGQQTFWGLDRTAIPAAPAPVPTQPDVAPRDKWGYSRVNPQEHFAEVYAKAVHVPKQLHDELVVQPAELVKQAKDAVEVQERAIARLERTPKPSADEVLEMRVELTRLERDAATKVRAETQRAEQFRVMRNDVFHTNDATKAAARRLTAKGNNPAAVQAFEQRAAAASTPEQVELLERELQP